MYESAILDQSDGHSIMGFSRGRVQKTTSRVVFVCARIDSEMSFQLLQTPNGRIPECWDKGHRQPESLTFKPGETHHRHHHRSPE